MAFKMNTESLLKKENDVLSTTGLTFHKFAGLEGDIAKNDSLHGYEVDRNFYNLKAQDIKSAHYDNDECAVVLVRWNGERLRIELPIMEMLNEALGSAGFATKDDLEKMKRDILREVLPQ